MPRRDYGCPDCADKDLEIQSLSAELAAARANALRYEHECHALRREIQALRQDRGSHTERLTRP